jgi:hemerythrin superfamily protein
MATDTMTNREGTTGAAADAIELLTTQHREVAQLWSQLQQSHRDGAELQHDLADRIVTMLSKHDAIETQLLYPELRERCGEQGRRMSDHSLEEHQQVREMLAEVDGHDISDPRVFDTMSRCLQAVLHHVEEEEGKVFPVLRGHVDEARLMDLGQQMATMMPTAPTHPHPHMPDSKTGAKVAGAVSSAIDHTRDAITGRGDDQR